MCNPYRGITGVHCFQERLFLFRELICKDVDWTGLGILAYKCFNTLFSNILAETVVTGRATAGTGSGSAGTSVPGLRLVPWFAYVCLCHVFVCIRNLNAKLRWVK